jgi:hypothetical protein
MPQNVFSNNENYLGRRRILKGISIYTSPNPTDKEKTKKP